MSTKFVLFMFFLVAPMILATTDSTSTMPKHGFVGAADMQNVSSFRQTRQAVRNLAEQ